MTKLATRSQGPISTAIEAEHDEEVIEEDSHTSDTKSLAYFEGLEVGVQKRLVKDYIRLCLYSELSRQEVTREEIGKKVLHGHVKAFSAVQFKAEASLRSDFGMELVQTSSRSNKTNAIKLKRAWILRSTLPSENRVEIKLDSNEDNWLPLLTIILSIIYGSGNSLSYESLKSHMAKLALDIEATSEEFGDMKELMKLWKKHGYLATQTSSGDGKTYYWGPRSIAIFPEDSIVEFMCSMYPDYDKVKLDTLRKDIERAGNS